MSCSVVHNTLNLMWSHFVFLISSDKYSVYEDSDTKTAHSVNIQTEGQFMHWSLMLAITDVLLWEFHYFALLHQQLWIRLLYYVVLCFLCTAAPVRGTFRNTQRLRSANCIHSFVSENVLGPTFEAAELAEDTKVSIVPVCKLWCCCFFWPLGCVH